VRAHLDQGLKDFEDVEFSAWCDLNAETAAARREQVGGRGEVYTDARTMLDEVKPDAVYIMLPPFAHGPAEKLVIERRLPFFVEKPVAIDLATARRVAEGVRKHKLITCVGYMTRYRKSVQRVRGLLRA
jgi:predicted dehydrogenase